MPSRNLGAQELLNAAQSAVWSNRNGSILGSLGLQFCNQGEWALPNGASLQTSLPGVIGQYLSAEGSEPDGGGGTDLWQSVKHTIALHGLRLLGDTDQKGVQILTFGRALWDFFAQGDFRSVPGFTPPGGMRIKRIYPARLEILEGFVLEDIAEIEQCTVHVVVEADSYNI